MLMRRLESNVSNRLHADQDVFRDGRVEEVTDYKCTLFRYNEKYAEFSTESTTRVYVETV